jgi:hypothetical protein
MMNDLSKRLRDLADKFSEGWHDGIKIDATDIELLADAAAALAEPEQSEPVAWAATSKHVVGGVAEVHLLLNKPQGDWFASAMPLFAAPPRREPYADKAAMFAGSDRIRIDPVTGNVGIGGKG